MPPTPKRSSQRRRTNSPAVDKAVSDGQIRGPELTGDHSDLGRRWWEALRRSGQAQWFEPSDWMQAEIVVAGIDNFVEKPSAAMLNMISQASGPLLVTEGDRRRLRVELERVPESEEDADVSELGEYRRRLGAG